MMPAVHTGNNGGGLYLSPFAFTLMERIPAYKKQTNGFHNKFKNEILSTRHYRFFPPKNPTPPITILFSERKDKKNTYAAASSIMLKSRTYIID